MGEIIIFYAMQLIFYKVSKNFIVFGGHDPCFPLIPPVYVAKFILKGYWKRVSYVEATCFSWSLMIGLSV